jgi:hypothetical protein
MIFLNKYSLMAFPGLVQDLTSVIYNYTDGQTRYMLSMAAVDWNIYCLRHVKEINNSINDV